ncbi:MAG: DUF1003 domain-containing protein [Nanoarchaeota archaeon]|nr:DUF1003 domain-containing protein [Nanoarchaeota archaeon]
MVNKDNKAQKHPILTAKRTFGQKASDLITYWAGSWVFIFLFLLILLLWIATNAYFLIQYEIGKPWDPYPFILLNLFLSMLAAIQAPVILMSQNRQIQKDRIRSEYDYAVNRKAEREITDIKQLILELYTHKKG